MPTARFLLPLVAVLSFACAHSGSPAARLADAARQAEGTRPPARELALAGFHALLVASDATRAQARFDAALAADSTEPYAYAGRIVLAQRSGHPEAVLEQALFMLERSHP